MNNSHRSSLILVLWWLLLVVAVQRIPFPLEETRQLAVAWEMWRDAQWWVPQLNGQPYADHPPLLYWLIHSGWWLLGVDVTWPFMVPVVFQALSLFWAGRIGRLLWPHTGMATTTVVLLSGLLPWAAVSTALIFEFLLTGFVLLGVLGLVLSDKGRYWQGTAVLSLAIAGGLLSHGPVILVYLLPVTLLAPWWASSALSWARWYSSMASALLLGTGLALLWLLLASQHAGTDYVGAVITQQVYKPLHTLLTGDQPLWGFVPLLPLVFFPWLLWPTAWQALASLSRQDRGVKLIVAWLVPSFMLLSLNSHKQPQDLLPLLPAFSLLLARGLLSLPLRPERALLPTLGLLIWAGILSSVPMVAAWHGGSDGLTHVHPAWGLVIALLAVGIACTRSTWSQRVLLLSSTTLVLVIVIHLSVLRSLTPAYDVQPASHYLAELQQQSRPIAHLSRYNGQFHFTGRLTADLTEVYSLTELRAWSRQHPEGWVVAYYYDWPLPVPETAPLQQPYRSGGLALWRAAQLLDNPELQERLRF